MEMSGAWLAECLVDKDMDFLNCGTLAPTLRRAFASMNEARLRWIQRGPGASLEVRSARGYLNMMEEQDKCRHVVANWLGVKPTSVALLGNVTDGINSALQSFDWSPGDRILTSSEEHDALRYPLRQLTRRFGVAIDTVDFPQSIAHVPGFAAELRHRITDNTKLVAVSQVSHATGVPLDLKALVETLLSVPEVFLLVDGAHAAGTTPELLHPRIDFYTFPGHKWLFGPVETGVLYVSPRAMDDTTPLLSGAPMISQDGVRLMSQSGAWRYEYGTRDWAKMVGLSEAIQFRSQWSESDIAKHYGMLGETFTDKFQMKTDVELIGRAPLLSFPTSQSNLIANFLWENHRVLLKPQERNIRISLPPWLTMERASELGHLIGSTVERFRAQAQ